MIRAAELDALLVEALPELANDRTDYARRQAQDPEFMQSFFSYSFVPTLQAALDRNLALFSQRAFTLVEQLVTEGDEELLNLLKQEFFDYGPACEKWMQRTLSYMGPHTRALALAQNSRSSS